MVDWLQVNWLQFVANGLAVGGIVLLAATGLSLLYGVKRFANFAHGDLLTLGAYLCFAGWVELGLGFPGGVLLALLGVPLLGLALEGGIFARLRSRPPAVALIVSVGVSFALQNVLRVVWGTRDRQFPVLAETAIPLFGDVALTPTKMAIIVLAGATALGLHLLLTRTTLGRVLRATADDYDLARIAGVPTRRVEGYAWALSCALAAAAGIALGAVSSIQPTRGFDLLLLVFSAVILGGIGSPYGAMLGALVIGLATEVSKPALELAGTSSTLSPAIAFIILVAMLLVRPEGLVGERGRAGGRRLRRKRGVTRPG